MGWKGSKNQIWRGVKGQIMELNLSGIYESLRDRAKEAWAEGDMERVLGYMDSTRGLEFVIANMPILVERNLFEKALIRAYIAPKINWSGFPFRYVKFLFDIADREDLIEAGDPLPGDGPFTVYRGVSGRGPARRIRGISWTASIKKAMWFSTRLGREKPAVFEAGVDKSLVFAYWNQRNESEFLCDIPRDFKLKKVWPEGGSLPWRGYPRHRPPEWLVKPK